MIRQADVPWVQPGLKVILLTIANLVHCFTWRLPDSMTLEQLSMEETFLLAMPRKVPLEAVIEPKACGSLVYM
ncbi:hypothetical protein BAE44_0006035 [Dichanthelium oligosanthes]|uniref:Uncharacterized protein n=1 Tax=Dichanthelium oligosanthes TaxID=888268 RepID=A0A1E5W6C4_9POAL|nr:hypothetical protein BAE44_0006035 [Dichanthelium oligosanthes]